MLAFGYDGVEVRKGFVYGGGVHFAGGVVAFLDQLLEVTSGDLDGDAVGDDLTGALLLLDPGGAGQGDTHWAPIDVEADIHGIGMTRSNGHDVCSPLAVEVFAGPAVGHVEIFVHVISLSSGGIESKDAGQGSLSAKRPGGLASQATGRLVRLR